MLPHATLVHARAYGEDQNHSYRTVGRYGRGELHRTSARRFKALPAYPPSPAFSRKLCHRPTIVRTLRCEACSMVRRVPKSSELTEMGARVSARACRPMQSKVSFGFLSDLELQALIAQTMVLSRRPLILSSRWTDGQMCALHNDNDPGRRPYQLGCRLLCRNTDTVVSGPRHCTWRRKTRSPSVKVTEGVRCPSLLML